MEPGPEPEPDELEEEPLVMLLSDDEHRRVLAELALPDLASVARVSRHWRAQVADDFLWQTLLRRDVSPAMVPARPPSFRLAYKACQSFALLPGTCLEVRAALSDYNSDEVQWRGTETRRAKPRGPLEVLDPYDIWSGWPWVHLSFGQ
jgi:hypothetical protein